MFSIIIFGQISNVVLVSVLSFPSITINVFVIHASMDICAVMPGNRLMSKNVSRSGFYPCTCGYQVIFCIFSSHSKSETQVFNQCYWFGSRRMN